MTIIDHLCKLIPNTNSTSDVVILRLDVIGDFILFCDSAKEYRALFPNQKITLIANQSWVELALKLPYWDNVIPVDFYKFGTDILYRFKIVVKLRKCFYKVLIHPTYSRDYLVSDAIVHVMKSKVKIGFDGDHSNISIAEKRISDSWYTKLVKPDKSNIMELNRNAGFVQNLGFSEFKSSIPNLSPVLSGVKSPVFCKNKYFVIFPFASWYGKVWPHDKFISLVNELSRKYNLDCVICGGKNDVDSARIIANQCDNKVHDYTGKTDLITLAAIIKGSQLVVSNDTSAIHLAASVGTKSVCILGGGHYGRFLPYIFDVGDKSLSPVTVTSEMDCFGCNWMCPYLKNENLAVPCVSNVGVDNVFKACIDQL